MDNFACEILCALERISSGAKVLNKYIAEGQAMEIGENLIRYKKHYGELPTFPDPALSIATEILAPMLRKLDEERKETG